MLKELIKIANELDSRGLAKEADALDNIIKLSGRRVVEKIGDVKIYKDSDWGEYVVVPKGATPTCDSAYHTDDMEDAVDTARSMDKKELNKEAGGCGGGNKNSLYGPEGKEIKDYERPEDESRIERMTGDLLDYLASDESTEDAWEFIKGLFSKKSSEENKVIKTAGGLSTHRMLEEEKQGDEELKIAGLMLAEAKRRSGREDISKEMLREFLLDTHGDVQRLMKELTDSMSVFNMEPFDDEPTELVEDTSRYNPNKPWDALFPPSQD